MKALSAALGLLALAPLPAWAHPHVWVEARAEVVYDPEGRLLAVRHAWTFDEAFSAFAVQGLDENGDKKLSRTELQPLAEVNVTSLEEYRFFTFLKAARREAKFAAPTDYWLDYDGAKLILHYTLPVRQPAAPGREPVTLEVYDPEYFVAFTMSADNPVRLAGARPDCRSQVQGPKPLDPATASTLAQIPAESRELPPELAELTGDLANRITITCGG